MGTARISAATYGSALAPACPQPVKPSERTASGIQSVMPQNSIP